jgi:pyruvate/2-oxoglutarate dehydrogenase complex dihydrolipoamide acyltransferase (E2) component
MPTSTLGDQRWVQVGTNSAGDLMYERKVSVEGAEATGAAEELAAELGVDLATVTGTGKDGKITVADVKAQAG